MTAWNPLVNTNFSLEEDYGLQDGYTKELQFASGKKRTWLTDSYAPAEYPSISLMLDNKTPKENGKTEFREFADWFEITLRYGTLPFSVTKLGYITKWYVKEDAIGIYKFIPDSVKYDKIPGMVLVSFGLKVIDIVPEVQYTFLAANNGQILLTNDKRPIVVY
jgi:hypothetical protein